MKAQKFDAALASLGVSEERFVELKVPFFTSARADGRRSRKNFRPIPIGAESEIIIHFCSSRQSIPKKGILEKKLLQVINEQRRKNGSATEVVSRFGETCVWQGRAQTLEHRASTQKDCPPTLVDFEKVLVDKKVKLQRTLRTGGAKGPGVVYHRGLGCGSGFLTSNDADTGAASFVLLLLPSLLPASC